MKFDCFFPGIFAAALFLLASCTEEREMSSINPANWEKRMTSIPILDSLIEGTSYLSVYSQVYSITEHLSLDLAATVSLRNVNRADTIYIKRAEYYATDGSLIRTYFDRPVFIAPLETIEIIIDRTDRAGGSGANFLFDWAIKPGIHEPFFEAVMISTESSQGISFVTEGKKQNSIIMRNNARNLTKTKLSVLFRTTSNGLSLGIRSQNLSARRFCSPKYPFDILSLDSRVLCRVQT